MSTSSQTQPQSPPLPPTTADRRRELLMAATSVQEQLVATLPDAALPDRIGTYDTHPQWPLDAVGLELRYTGGRPDALTAVRALAEVLGVRTRVQHVVSGQDGHSYLLTSAEGTYQGIHACAWTTADDPARPAPADTRPDLSHAPATPAPAPVTPQSLTTRRWLLEERTMPLTAIQTETAEGGEQR